MNRTDDHMQNHLMPDVFYFVITMAGYIIVGLNLYKMQPVLPTLMEYLQIDEAGAGSLISLGSLVSLFCTIPLGVFVSKKGYQLIMVIALVLELSGSLAGYFMTSYSGIILSQLLLGFASTIFLVCCPSILQTVYDKQKYASYIGILNACQTAGMAICFGVIPVITLRLGVPHMFLIALIPAVLLLFVWLFFFRKDTEEALKQRAASRLQADQDTETPESADLSVSSRTKSASPLKDPMIWFLSVAVFFIMLSAGAVLNFVSSYLNAERGYTVEQAARITLSCTVVGVIICIFCGVIMNLFGKRMTYAVIVLVLTLLRFLQVTIPDGIPLYIVTAMQGLPAAAVVVANAVLPSLCHDIHTRPLAVSMISTASTAGLTVSSVIFGALVASFGYRVAFYVFIPVSLVALIGLIPIRHATASDTKSQGA